MAANHAGHVHVHHHKDAAGFGHADIGFIGGLFLMTNNIIGPAMLQLPGVFQISGWLPALSVLVICAIWTVMSGQLLARAMSLFPGNETFSHRLEFGKIAFHVFPRWLYYVTVFTMVFVFFTQNLANILVTAQTMDNMILASAGKTCAIVLDAGASNHFQCITSDTQDNSSDSLFGKSTVFTLGYAVTLVVAIPLGIMNLDDNIIIQIGGMLLTFVCVIVWVLNFCAMGLKKTLLPDMAPNGDTGYLQLLPAILFNYGFVTTVPSWINEKRKDVRVGTTLVGAQVLASVQYVLTAVFAGLAMDFSDGVDITARLNDPKQHGVWLASRIMTFIFPLANILTSIPVFSIIIRYNLLQLEGFKMPVWLANAVAVFLPWVVAVPFYSGNQVNTLITWSSALLFVQIQLLIPTAMFVMAEKKRAAGTLALPFDENDYEEELDLEEDDSGLPVPLFASPKWASRMKASLLTNGDSEGSESLEGSKDGKSGLLTLLSAAKLGPKRKVRFTDEDEGEEAEVKVVGRDESPEDIHALPGFVRRCVNELAFGKALLAISVMVAGAAIGLQIWSQISNPPPE